MKFKLLGILLLICLIAPVATSYYSLRFERKMVRKEVKRRIIAGLDREDLVLITVSQEESQTVLKWKHSKEFEYKDQMYDIVESECKDGMIHYWCWWDHEETSLNKKLTELAAMAFSNHPGKEKHQKKLHLYFKTLFFQNSSIQPEIASSSNTTKGHFYYKRVYQNNLVSPPFPPPQLA